MRAGGDPSTILPLVGRVRSKRRSIGEPACLYLTSPPTLLSPPHKGEGSRRRRAPPLRSPPLQSRPAHDHHRRLFTQPSLPPRPLLRARKWRCCSASSLVIAFFSFTAENFFSVRNMTNVLGQASLALTAGIGCAIVFMSGEVDISIGSLLAAIALPLILIMNATGSLALGVGGALLLGLIIGSVNGYLTAYAGINSLIVTLGTMFILRGGVYLYTGQRAIPDDAAARQLHRPVGRPPVQRHPLFGGDRAGPAFRLRLHDAAPARSAGRSMRWAAIRKWRGWPATTCAASSSSAS